jgi:hypothetical protein
MLVGFWLGDQVIGCYYILCDLTIHLATCQFPLWRGCPQGGRCLRGERSGCLFFGTTPSAHKGHLPQRRSLHLVVKIVCLLNTQDIYQTREELLASLNRHRSSERYSIELNTCRLSLKAWGCCPSQLPTIDYQLLTKNICLIKSLLIRSRISLS